MMKVGYENLIVWQKSMDLVEEIYQITNKFPQSELYGLTSQMRRSSVSIPSNIAEGSRRGGEKETKRFFLISFGSGAELETQMKIAKRLKFIKESDSVKADNLLEEVMKMLNKIVNS